MVWSASPDQEQIACFYAYHHPQTLH